jgi:hypothetical protein
MDVNAPGRQEQGAPARRRLFDIGGFTGEFLIFPTQADGIGKLRP